MHALCGGVQDGYIFEYVPSRDTPALRRGSGRFGQLMVPPTQMDMFRSLGLEALIRIQCSNLLRRLSLNLR